jgi:tetratricopeptide (TPR) repeat protein
MRRALIAIFVLFLGISSAAVTQQFIARYQRAENMMDQGFYEQASREFHGILGEARANGFFGEVQFRIAECAFDGGRFLEAVQSFEAMAKSADLAYQYIKPEAQYALGLSYLMQGNYEMAANYFRQTSLADRAQFGEAITAYRKAPSEKEKDLSKQDYDNAVSKLTGLETPLAQFYAARSYIQLKKPLDAIAILNKVIRAYPNTPFEKFARYNLGDALFNYGDYGGALIKFSEYLSQYPQDTVLAPYATYKLSASLIEQRRFQEAIDKLRPLERHQDRYLVAHARYFMGVAYERLNRLDDALREFQQVRSAYPDLDIAFFAAFKIYETYRSQGKSDMARVSAQAFGAMVRGGGAPERFEGIGEFVKAIDEFEHKDYGRALADFTTIYERYKDTPMREAAEAMILLCDNLLDRYGDAVGTGSKYITDYPDAVKGWEDWRSRILYNLADGYYYQGNMPDAEKYYGLVKNSNLYVEVNALSRASLGWIYLGQNRYSEALGEFQYSIGTKEEKGSMNVQAVVVSLFGAGIAYYNQRPKPMYDSALAYFAFDKEGYQKAGLLCDVSSKLVPSNLYYAGDCYNRLLYFANALSSWERLINDYPENPKAAKAALALAELYYRGQKTDDAIARLDWVVSHFPNSDEAEEAKLRTASYYYSKGELDKSLSLYQDFIRATGNDSLKDIAGGQIEMVYYRKAKSASTADSMADFIAQLKAERPQSKYLGELYYDLGERYSKAKDFNKAIENYRQIIGDTTYMADARLAIGESYFNLNDWQSAFDEYRKFSEQFPTHKAVAGAIYYQAAAYFNIGQNYVKDGNPAWRNYIQQAMALFQEVINKYSKGEFIENARKSAKTCAELLK